MKRVVCEVTIQGRTYTLVVDESLRGRIYEWFENRLFAQAATALEIAMVEYVERVQSDMAELRCVAWGIRTCEDCGNAMCPFKIGTRGISRDPQQPKLKESESMPSKKDLKAAKKAGVNPYAVAQAAVNKGQIKPSQKEAVVKGVTKTAIAKKRGRKKGQ